MAGKQNPKSPHPYANDVDVTPMGTIAMVRPITEAGERWMNENCRIEQWQWFNGALVVDPRYVGDLVNAMRKQGHLNVSYGGGGKSGGAIK